MSDILDPYALFIQSKSLYRFVELISLNYYIKIYQDIYRDGKSQMNNNTFLILLKLSLDNI